MSAGTQKGSTTIRVALDTYDELAKQQQAFEAEHQGATISMDAIIKRLLAGQPVQP